MRPFPQHRIEPGRRRFHHAQARIRTLLLAALCLFIGMGLGALWHSRRAPGQDLGTLSAGTTAVQGVKVPVQSSRVLGPAAPASPVAAVTTVDPAIVAEVKRLIPNFASVSLEEGSRILRETALKDLRAALSQMEGQLKEAEQRVAQAEEAKSGPEKQEALKELQRLQAQQAAKLREYTMRSSAQIEALRQLQEPAR